VLSIIEVAYENQEERIALYDSLNFQRDAILRLGKSVLLWLTVEDAFEVANHAPDFWSRRTAVYHFDNVSAQALISRLFRNSPIPRETFVSDASLSECLEIILQKETQLQTHVNPQSELDISHAKECQQRLISAANQLLAAVDDGKALELALWLWNLSNLDSDLQVWLSGMDNIHRNRFESIYTDRNEVILSLAGDLSKIIKQYKTGITRHLGKPTPASLLDIFWDRASKYLEEIAWKLSSDSAGDSSTDPNRYGVEIDSNYVYDTRTIDSEVAAQDLESWLSGSTWKRPKYLSEAEGNLLKDLYNGRLVLGRTEQSKAADKRVRGKVEELQNKLRLQLGVSPSQINKSGISFASVTGAKQIVNVLESRRSRSRS
jgi:hypothetical protein